MINVKLYIPVSQGQIGLSVARRSSIESTDSVVVGRSLYWEMALNSFFLSSLIRLRILCRCLLRSAAKNTAKRILRRICIKLVIVLMDIQKAPYKLCYKAHISSAIKNAIVEYFDYTSGHLTIINNLECGQCSSNAGSWVMVTLDI